MHSTIITLTKHNFHMRPLALINSLASYFPDNCKISIVYNKDKYNIKSFMNLVNFMTAFTTPPYQFELNVDCQEQNIANLCLIVMKTLFLNINMVFFNESPFLRSKQEEIEAYRELFNVIEEQVTNYAEISQEQSTHFINALRGILGLKKCRKKAILNSVNGMHVIVCTQLGLIASLLNCKITLDCTDRNNEPQNCDIKDIMGLLNLAVPNASVIYINSEGKNCEESAEIIKYILEHIDSTIAAWQINTHFDKRELGKNLLAFIRTEIKS